jgi:hypothetical protein
VFGEPPLRSSQKAAKRSHPFPITSPQTLDKRRRRSIFSEMRPRGRGDDFDEDDDDDEFEDVSPLRTTPEPEPEPEPEVDRETEPAPPRPPLSSLVVRPPPQENGRSSPAPTADRPSRSPSPPNGGPRRGSPPPRRRRAFSPPGPRGWDRRRSPPPPVRRRTFSPPPPRRRYSPPRFQPSRHPRFHDEPQGLLQIPWISLFPITQFMNSLVYVMVLSCMALWIHTLVFTFPVR